MADVLQLNLSPAQHNMPAWVAHICNINASYSIIYARGENVTHNDRHRPHDHTHVGEM
jgi:hypothetical protein